MSETYNKISRALSHHHAVKSRKALVAKHVELLSVLDSHMLNDIGMKNFNGLAPAEQENLLLDTIKRA